jgi:hypothetical protein
MDKVAIILTDGVNPVVRLANPPAQEPRRRLHRAYGLVSEGRLGTVNGGAATTEINNRMLAVCNSMKTEASSFSRSPSSSTKRDLGPLPQLRHLARTLLRLAVE